MPIEFTEYLEATQMNLMSLLEFVVQLFIICDCAALLFCLASIVWLSYREARQPRSIQQQAARLITRKEAFMPRVTS